MRYVVVGLICSLGLLGACSTTATSWKYTAKEVRNHNYDYKQSVVAPALVVSGPHRPARTLYRITPLAPGHCTPISDCPATIEPPDFRD